VFSDIFTKLCFLVSLYTVIATSVERVLQLRKPEQANKGSFLAYILPVLVFSVIYNIPKCFEFKTLFNEDTGLPEIGVQDFRKNVQYTYYIHGSNLVFLGVLPFAILIVCHANIHRNFKFILTTEEYARSTMLRVLDTMVIVQLVGRTPKTALDAYELLMVIPVRVV